MLFLYMSLRAGERDMQFNFIKMLALPELKKFRYFKKYYEMYSCTEGENIGMIKKKKIV